MDKQTLWKIANCITWNNVPKSLVNVAKSAARQGYIQTLKQREKAWPWWKTKMLSQRGGDRRIVLTSKGEDICNG